MRSLVFAALCLCASLACANSGVSLDDSLKYEKLKTEGFDLRAKPEQTLAALEAAVKIYADDGDLWWRLGQLRLVAKQYEPAIEAYQKAMSIGAFGNKFKAAAMYDIACAYSLEGNPNKSFDWLRQSLNAGFRDLDHVRTDTDLNSLHGDRRWEDLAATKDVSKMSRDEAWRYDLWLLNREVTRIHYNAYGHYSKADMDAWVRRLDDNIPHMDDQQIEVAFMKYMRRIGDGHTHIRPPQAGPNPTLPLQLYYFSDGMFVTAADPKLDLVGARIVKICGKSVEDTLKMLDEIVPSDNRQGLLSNGPMLLTSPAVLHGLGLMPKKDSVDFVVVDSSGKERQVTVQAEPKPDAKNFVTARDSTESASPLYLKHRDKNYWFEYLPETKTVYFQYNAVQDMPGESTEKFAARMFDFIDKNDVQRLVVDARWNGGGNTFLHRPLTNGIIGCKKINGHGSLFIIAGRQTFSAAQNFVTDLERAVGPIFVGEPTGSCPNFVGESIRFSLPYSKMMGTISDLYWQRSWPMDARLWIAPDLPAPPSFEMLKANRDPAMEAIQAYLKASG